jgi:hypothetical protein
MIPQSSKQRQHVLRYNNMKIKAEYTLSMAKNTTILKEKRHSTRKNDSGGKMNQAINNKQFCCPLLLQNSMKKKCQSHTPHMAVNLNIDPNRK